MTYPLEEVDRSLLDFKQVSLLVRRGAVITGSVRGWLSTHVEVSPQIFVILMVTVRARSGATEVQDTSCLSTVFSSVTHSQCLIVAFAILFYKLYNIWK